MCVVRFIPVTCLGWIEGGFVIMLAYVTGAKQYGYKINALEAILITECAVSFKSAQLPKGMILCTVGFLANVFIMC